MNRSNHEDPHYAEILYVVRKDDGRLLRALALGPGWFPPPGPDGRVPIGFFGGG